MHEAVLSSSDDFASIGWREGTAARQESHTEALFPKRKQTYYPELASGIATLSYLQTILMRGASQ